MQTACHVHPNNTIKIKNTKYYSVTPINNYQI